MIMRGSKAGEECRGVVVILFLLYDNEIHSFIPRIPENGADFVSKKQCDGRSMILETRKYGQVCLSRKRWGSKVAMIFGCVECVLCFVCCACTYGLCMSSYPWRDKKNIYKAIQMHPTGIYRIYTHHAGKYSHDDDALLVDRAKF